VPDIVTLTLNPALDLTTSVDRVQPVHKLRCNEVSIDAGGGGVNVARVLQRMGSDHLAVYFAGGLTGREHEKLLRQHHVNVCVVPIEGETRESFSVHENQSTNDFRFVLPGPVVSAAELMQLVETLKTHWPSRYLVVSGGVAPGVAPAFYAELADLCHERSTLLVLDSNGEALKQGLSRGVFLVKPSWRELEELTGEKLPTQRAVLLAAQNLIREGHAALVAVSMGDQGGMLVQSDRAWHAPALSVVAQTTVGAGDSFLALMIWALNEGKPASQAFAYAMAGGACALLRPGTSLCDPADVQQWVTQVKLIPI
jgi:6-phosphofructokinase 2